MPQQPMQAMHSYEMRRKPTYRRCCLDALLEAELLACDICGRRTEDGRVKWSKRAGADRSGADRQAAADCAPAAGGEHLEAAEQGPAL